VVMITTPNEENLEKGEVICPECGCTFHRMQHINTYSSEDLTNLMMKYGFEKKAVLTTTFEKNSVENKIKKIYKFIRNKVTRDKPKDKHLVYFGVK